MQIIILLYRHFVVSELKLQPYLYLLILSESSKIHAQKFKAHHTAAVVSVYRLRYRRIAYRSTLQVRGVASPTAPRPPCARTNINFINFIHVISNRIIKTQSFLPMLEHPLLSAWTEAPRSCDTPTNTVKIVIIINLAALCLRLGTP
jgi:hypothetical protein